MFLICKTKEACLRSLSKLITGIEGIECGPIIFINIKEHWLGWARSKPHENLHVFNDGIIIGKLVFSEQATNIIIKHNENFPIAVHPLTTGLSIKIYNDSVIIKPFNITNIYYGGNSVSDMQLLCADAEGYLPSPEGVSVLSTIGFFPGNMTLFNDIKKIPLFSSYNLPTKQLTNISPFSIQKPNDAEMLERFKAIIPYHPLQYLGMSSGYDCRFILGILLQAGINPHLVHVTGDDTGNVTKIANQLNLSCTNITIEEASYLPPEIYTYLSDAQLYFRGGNYSCVRHSINSESIYYTGTIPYGTLRYYPMVPVKMPGRIGAIYGGFIDHLFISQREVMTNGLREMNSLKHIKTYLLNELSFSNEYCSFRTKSEYTNWLFYLHRGIRWSPAFLADLSYFTYPVFLLADIEALSLGISSGVWQNFRNDRLRKLNASLLPELTVSYSDGTTYRVESGIKNVWDKLQYEYGERLKSYYCNPVAQYKRIINRYKLPSPIPKNVFPFDKVSFHAQDFTNYFLKDINEIISGPNYSYWLKRAAVTVGYTLQFLGH